VTAVTSEGQILAVYESAEDASTWTATLLANVTNCCLGKVEAVGGIIFRFAEPSLELNPLTAEELQEAMHAACERGEHVFSEVQSKKVQVVTSYGRTLAVYESAEYAREVMRRTGIDHSNDITRVCDGHRKHANGYIFRYAKANTVLKQLSLEELDEAIRVAIENDEHVAIKVAEVGNKRRHNAKKVEAVTSTGQVLAVYEMAAECSRRIGIAHGRITNVCLGKTAHVNGYLFRYAEPKAKLNQLSAEELLEARQKAIERGDHVAIQATCSKSATKPQKIQVETTKGVQLAVYESIIEATRRLGVDQHLIIACCLGQSESAKSFIFRFTSQEAQPKQLSLAELYEARRSAVLRGEEVESAATTAAFPTFAPSAPATSTASTSASTSTSAAAAAAGEEEGRKRRRVRKETKGYDDAEDEDEEEWLDRRPVARPQGQRTGNSSNGSVSDDSLSSVPRAVPASLPSTHRLLHHDFASSTTSQVDEGKGVLQGNVRALIEAAKSVDFLSAISSSSNKGNGLTADTSTSTSSPR